MANAPAHAEGKHAAIREEVVEETRRYIVYWVYLAMMFMAFITYRHLVLAEYDISYVNYGYALLQALILAKVILIGEAFHFGETLSGRELPLIVPTLYKSVMFGLLVAVFFVLEKLLEGAIHRRDLAQIGADIVSKGRNEIIGHVLIMTVSFIPFFAFRELGRALGGVDIIDLFFRGGKGTAPMSSRP
jgi:hypothetical protein